jgi:hypothetical protein
MKKFCNMLVNLCKGFATAVTPKITIAVIGNAEACVSLTNAWIDRAAREGRRGALYTVPPFEPANGFWESKIYVDDKWHDLEVWPSDKLIAADNPINGPVVLLIVLGKGMNPQLKTVMTAARKLASRHRHAKAAIAFSDHQCFGDRALDDPRMFRTSQELELIETDALAKNTGILAVEAHLTRVEKTMLPRWREARPLVEMLAANRIKLTNVYVLSSQSEDLVPGKDLPLDRWGVDEVLLDSIEFSRDRLRRPAKIGPGALSTAAAVALGSALFAWYHRAPAADIRHYTLMESELGPRATADAPLESLGYRQEGTPLIPQARMLERLNEMLTVLGELRDLSPNGAEPSDSIRKFGEVQRVWKKLQPDNLHPREEAVFGGTASDPQYRRVRFKIYKIIETSCAALSTLKDSKQRAYNVDAVRATIEKLKEVHQESEELRYVLNRAEMRSLQDDLDAWARRICAEIAESQPRTWHGALHAISASHRKYLADLNLPDNPFGPQLGDAIHRQCGDKSIALRPTHGAYRLELQLQARSKKQFVLDTSTGACYPILNGAVDYDRTSTDLPRVDGLRSVELTDLTLVGMRMAHASTGTWHEVLVKVDGKTQPVLLWALAAALRNRDDALSLEPATAEPQVLEVLEPLTRHDPWANDPYKLLPEMRAIKAKDAQR